MSKGKTKALSKSVRTESRRETYDECNTCPSIAVLAMETSLCSWIFHFRRASFLGQGLYLYFVFSSEKANSEINCWYHSMKTERRKVLKQGHCIEILIITQPSLPTHEFICHESWHHLTQRAFRSAICKFGLNFFFKIWKELNFIQIHSNFKPPVYLVRTFSLVHPWRLQEIF